MDDRQFVRNFGAVMAGLVLISVFVFVIANVMISEEEERSDPIVERAIEARIAPVGKVYVGSVPPAAQQPSTDAASQSGGGFADGKSVYEAVCLACHGTGVAGAPKTDDKAVWSDRMQAGIETLYSNAIKGKGAMPAKGGRADLSDEEVKWAVDYMIN